MAQGYRVPRGTALRSLLGRGEQTACEYRTAHDVTLWPLELTHAEYTGYVGDLGDLRLPTRARAALRLQLRTTAGLNFSDLALDELTLFVRGGDELPVRSTSSCSGTRWRWWSRPPTRPAPWQHVVTESPVVGGRLRGRRGAAALRPAFVSRVTGCLQEYFAVPGAVSCS